MGPRLVGRGKGEDVPAELVEAASFNGAASCGTRKVSGFAIVHLMHLWLQWGRVLWDAERSVLPSADSVGGYDAEIERLSGRAFA